MNITLPPFEDLDENGNCIGNDINFFIKNENRKEDILKSSLIEKFKLRVLKDTGVNIVSLRFIKRGTLTKNASFSFMATTDEGVEIGSTSTVSELLKKKEPIEILTGGLYTTGNWEFI